MGVDEARAEALGAAFAPAVMTRRSLLRSIASALSISAINLPARAMAAQPDQDLGALTPFYRSTQLQGHLFGMGLMEIPDYLEGSDVDLKYKKKTGARQVIPFVDTFVINRFLGGYREDWLQKFQLMRENLGRRSLDYVIRSHDGSLHFRPELIRGRLQPYLDAGYQPRDITIALENVPWDLATPNGLPAEEGPWGRRSPPGDLDEWARVIRQFASDLRAYLGGSAGEMHFEAGVEYDEKVSFDASAPQFFRFYETTDRALHSVLPEATFNPGEFTGLGLCTLRMSNCVYDTAAFVAFTRQEGLRILDLPRSLHSFLSRPATAWPSATAARAIQSYQRLPPVVAEIHQFGVIDEPFNHGTVAVGASDCAAIQANWEFQVLIRLWASLKPHRVFHWGGFISIGKNLPLLNGAGFLRLVLDHYLGWKAYLLHPRTSALADRAPAEVMALGLANGGRSAVLLSSFSIEPAGAAREVALDLPSVLPPAGAAPKAIRYRQSANVFTQIRDDLARDNNLRPEFAECRSCLAPPIRMARDADRARTMLLRNQPRYVATIKQNLRWTSADPGITRDGRHLRVTMEPNELVVIE
jgi:hypothetical protein